MKRLNVFASPTERGSQLVDVVGLLSEEELRCCGQGRLNSPGAGLPIDTF